MSRLLRIGLALREWGHHNRFEHATRQPEAAQAALLKALLRRNAETAFGRDHGFARIASPRDYARRVPMRDYEAFRPYVRRIDAGEADVLTGEPVAMFTTTSGTTGEPKLIPVTPSWRAEMASLMRLWLFAAVRDHSGCLDGTVLTIVSPAAEGRTAGGFPVGAMSGVIHQGMPRLVRRHSAIPYAVALIRDCEARYFVTMRLALAQRVTAVGTPNPTTLVRLAEVAAGGAEAMIRAIHDGSLGIRAPEMLNEPGRPGREGLREIEAALRPDPARARALGAVLGARGALAPRDCWPDLRLIGCWLGGSAGIHARRLVDPYGDVPLRDLGLVASEGRLTIPLEDGTAAGVLAVHANFYEFIPEDRLEDASPPVLLAHQLEPGQRYDVVLTGGNGLYRYDINDVVEVRGFHYATPVVAFVRKGRDMTSITGEKLHLNHVQAAVREAEDETKLEVWQFRLIPDVERCCYDLLVEFRGDRGGEGAGLAFLSAFDAALARLNVEYAGKRISRRLGPPRVHVMRAGWSERQCRADFALGRREVQYKWRAIGPEWDAASWGEVMQTVELKGGSTHGATWRSESQAGPLAGHGDVAGRRL